jgi:serine protease Do
MPVLEELRDAVSGAAAAAGPAVVGLRADGRPAGSGAVVAPGAILTSWRAGRRGALEVVFADGRTVEATALHGAAPAGLAIVRAETGDVAPIAWGDADALAVGSPVVALADPGGNGLRATLGFVSSTRALRRGRRATAAIEHTAPMARGSVGGPLVDGDGGLVAVNLLRQSGGLIVAVRAGADMRERIEGLARGRGATPRLGVALAPAHVARRLRRAVGLPELDGLLVRDVEEGSPAAEAGVRQGDLIVAAGDTPTADYDALFGALEGIEEGAEVELAIVRGGEERRVRVRPEATS